MSDSNDHWRIIGLLSAVGITVGAIMPWVEVQVLGFTGSWNGIYSGIGFATILAAIVIGWSFVFDTWDDKARAVVTFAGLVTVAIAGFLITDQGPLLAPENTEFTMQELKSIANAGAGLYVTLVGAIAALLSAWQRPLTPPDSSGEMHTE